ncbi:unnamed protein product [Bursaphelenchus okinawaensis]|uniref:non-specific protein-tyrosine kinase n=1 Tax=Bursaphelenchus okinawaensis TaxID=465554 RepID=A0A811JQC9_9BILA|nr:unnamed protein product [Bursaphelenchus okinawaensis]CAG9077958.1 unnamed protein product [Bursaphelenchus okinawaensis]
MRSKDPAADPMDGQPPNLYVILKEADLLQYHDKLRTVLKLRHAGDLLYTEEKDLTEIGMSRPEQKRLRREQNRFLNNQQSSSFYVKLRKVFGKSEARHSEVNPTTSSYLDQDEQHVISPDSVELCRELGRGEFGICYQGTWNLPDGNSVQVAIKRVLPDKLKANPSCFIQEAAVMSKMKHENLVRMYGIVLDTKAVMLISELALYGSLLECLRKPAGDLPYAVDKLCDFALQIARGMNYLNSKKVVHRDLAARNVLVYTPSQVKISDFGLSRSLGISEDYYRSEFTSTMKLPIAWCSPEAINLLKFTPASDVYAYGVTLWEMFSYGKMPWKGYSGSQILHTIDTQRKTLDCPEFCPHDFYTMMQKCWSHEPADRPTFEDIINQIPDLMPQLLVSVTECHNQEPMQLQFDKGDIIILLDKCPVTGENIYWHGATRQGRCGLFKPAETVAYLGAENPTNAPRLGPLPLYQNTVAVPEAKKERMSLIGRKNSQKSLDKEKKKLLISEPQGDLRHTCHIGIDGSVFGLVHVNKNDLSSTISPLIGLSDTASLAASQHNSSTSSISPSRSGTSSTTSSLKHNYDTEQMLRNGYDIPLRFPKPNQECASPPALPPKPAARIKPTQKSTENWAVQNGQGGQNGKFGQNGQNSMERGMKWQENGQNSVENGQKWSENGQNSIERPQKWQENGQNRINIDEEAKNHKQVYDNNMKNGQNLHDNLEKTHFPLRTNSFPEERSQNEGDYPRHRSVTTSGDFIIDHSASTAVFPEANSLQSSLDERHPPPFYHPQSPVPKKPVDEYQQASSESVVRPLKDSECQKLLKRIDSEHKKAAKELAKELQNSQKFKKDDEKDEKEQKEKEEWTNEAQQAYKLLVECGDVLKRTSPLPNGSPKFDRRSSSAETEATVIRAQSLYGNSFEADDFEHSAPPLPPKNGRPGCQYINNSLVGSAQHPQRESTEIELPISIEQRRTMDYENGNKLDAAPGVPPKPKARQNLPSAPTNRISSPQTVRFAPTVQKSALFSGFPKDEVVKF